MKFFPLFASNNSSNILLIQIITKISKKQHKYLHRYLIYLIKIFLVEIFKSIIFSQIVGG
ncbi:hypothetical protein DRQ29_06040 [bacterium]|nr:MAG: hypothetical protein DRQ29_06040 [bacterium]